MELCSLLVAYPFFVIPLAYVIYRLTRTVLALSWAILLYWMIPLAYSPNLKRFKMRWTVVTGGTDGIGKAYTFELARRGLRKFLLIGRSEVKLANVKAQLEELHPDCTVRTLLFDFETGDFAQLRTDLSDVDVGLAINSVGIGREYLERYGDRPEADRQILRVNGLGAAEFLSCILPPMEAHGGGQIVVVSSSQGVRPIPLLAAYSASKSLMSFLSEAIDREYKTVSVQTLIPAIVATNMTYYKKSSLFIVTPENFARQAVGTLGLATVTSGCFNHEFQLLCNHLIPWALLKYLLMPIYLYQQKRMLRFHADPSHTQIHSNGDEMMAEENGRSPTAEKKKSKIPTSNGASRNRA